MIGEKAVKSFGEKLATAMRAVADQMEAEPSPGGAPTVRTLRVIAAIIDQLVR